MVQWLETPPVTRKTQIRFIADGLITDRFVLLLHPSPFVYPREDEKPS